MEAPQLPELLETSKYFNKITAQKKLYIQCKKGKTEKEKKEAELIHFMDKLKLSNDVPFYP